MDNEFNSFLGEQLKELRVEISLLRNDLIKLGLEQGKGEVEMREVRLHIDKLDNSLAEILSRNQDSLRRSEGIPWKIVTPIGVGIAAIITGLVQVLQDVLSQR